LDEITELKKERQQTQGELLDEILDLQKEIKQTASAIFGELDKGFEATGCGSLEICRSDYENQKEKYLGNHPTPQKKEGD
jgi:hypothetical protein